MKKGRRREAEIPSGCNWAWETSVGEGYRDTWACDDSDKSPRRQNKARLPQICFQCSSVGELDDGWTGTGRNASMSKLLTIIKTCFFPFHSLPSFAATCSHAACNPFHLISIWLCLCLVLCPVCFSVLHTLLFLGVSQFLHFHACFQVYGFKNFSHLSSFLLNCLSFHPSIFFLLSLNTFTLLHYSIHPFIHPSMTLMYEKLWQALDTFLNVSPHPSISLLPLFLQSFLPFVRASIRVYDMTRIVTSS